jgi:DNA-nicking Smr family endonuclease
MRSAGSKARIRRAEPDFATVARAEPMPKRSLATGLADLAAFRDALRDEALRQAQADALARREREQREREAHLFRNSVGDAVPLPPTGRIDPPGVAIEPTARQFEQDELCALAESISDEIDIDRLLDTDGDLSFRRPGVGADVVRRLRRGHWVLQSQIDLHGLRVDEAREVLVNYLTDCMKRERRCIRVIHGKGLGSVNKEPVLKGKVLKWLAQRNEVLAFCQAAPADGGSGALIVLLRPPASRIRKR